MDLAYVPLGPALWQEFSSWWVARGLKVPAHPFGGLFVMSGRGLLVGVCFRYLEHGNGLLLTDFATNPVAPQRHRHAATELLLRGLRVHSVATAKTLVCAPMGRSLMRLARKHGFNVGEHSMLLQYAPIWVIPGAYRDRERPAPAESPPAPPAPTKPPVAKPKAKKRGARK